MCEFPFLHKFITREKVIKKMYLRTYYFLSSRAVLIYAFCREYIGLFLFFFCFLYLFPHKKETRYKKLSFFSLIFLFHNQQLNYSHEIKTGALWNQQEWAKYEVAATDYLSSSMLKGDDRGNLMDWMKYRNILNRVSNICENYIKIK